MNSWNEIRKAATAFAKRWKNAYDEKSQAQSFLKEFFAVFGVDTVVFNAFEHRVKFTDGSQGYADCFWQGRILVEMKSAGRDLDAAYQQAMEYVRTLPPADYPRAVVVSDFQRFRFYNLEKDNALTEFALKDLRKYVTLFGFMIGDDGEDAVATQDPVNRKAAEKMARLHDAMKAVGYTGHPLEVYLVRLLFCLFAEDTSIFKPEQLSYFIKCDSSPDGHDLAEKLASLFQTLNTPPERRLSILDESLAAFPYVNGVGKTVERYADGCWNATEIRSFVYDGWNLIHEAICTVNGTTTNATEVTTSRQCSGQEGPLNTIPSRSSKHGTISGRGMEVSGKERRWTRFGRHLESNPGMTGVGRTLIDCPGVRALRWVDEAKPESNSLVLEKTAALWSPSADKVGVAGYLSPVESSWKRERL